MPKLPAVTGMQAVRAFQTFGFAVDRIRGSHHIMTKDGHPNLLTVPVHGNRTLRPGTLRALIRDAGITVEEFIAALD